MNVLIMPPHWGHSALCQIITLLHIGFVKTLIPLLVLVLATTLETSCKNAVASKMKQHLYLRTGVSAVFSIGFFVSHARIRITCGFALSLFPRIHFALQVRQWKAQLRVSLPRRVLVNVLHTTCGILSWNLFHEQVSSILLLSVDEFDLAKIALSCHFALDLLCYKESAHNSA